MIPKPDTCRGCPLYGDGTGFVPDLIRPDSIVTLVAQNPGADEEAGRRVVEKIMGKPRYESCDPEPLTGLTGYAVNNTWLPKAGLHREDVSMMNVLKCRMIVNGKRTNHMPSGETLRRAVAHCSQYFNVPTNTKLIVSMGEHAYNALGGAKLREATPRGERPPLMSTFRGYLLPERYQGKYPVFQVVHPADLFRDRDMLVPTRMDWLRVRKILDGKWPLDIPPVNLLQTPDQVHELFNELSHCPHVVVDTEYARDSKFLTLVGIVGRRQDGTIVGGSLWWKESLAVDPGTRAAFVRRFKYLAEHQPVWFWNAKADVPVLRQAFTFGDARGSAYNKIEDGMILHHVCWSDSPHDLDHVASILGDYPKMKHLATRDLVLYNWGDCLETLTSIEKLLLHVAGYGRLLETYERKRRLLPIIMEREAAGLRVNKLFVEHIIPVYEQRLKDAETFCEAYAGYKLNLNSTGKKGQVARHMAAFEGVTLDSIGKDDIAEVRRTYLPFDAEAERKDFSSDYLLQRIDEGAHPILELRAFQAQIGQVMSHYLRPLVIDENR